ncbi:MAG: hypothetical protein JO317_02150 [Verrucomicrobiae bacterium]|nr:hypothetical protein [Verrucomicrobiae bacterium]
MKKADLLTYSAIFFLVGILVGSVTSYFTFEHSYATYRREEIREQKLELARYLQVLENKKTGDGDAREELTNYVKNRVKYLQDLEAAR